MFKQLLSKFNPKSLFINMAKNLAIKEIQKEGDRLQSRIVLELEEKGPAMVDKIVDEAQQRIISGIEKAVPQWAWLAPFKAKAAEAVQTFGDKAQEGLAEKAGKFGPSAVNLAFDKAQAELIERIKAI